MKSKKSTLNALYSTIFVANTLFFWLFVSSIFNAYLYFDIINPDAKTLSGLIKIEVSALNKLEAKESCDNTDCLRIKAKWIELKNTREFNEALANHHRIASYGLPQLLFRPFPWNIDTYHQYSAAHQIIKESIFELKEQDTLIFENAIYDAHITIISVVLLTFSISSGLLLLIKHLDASKTNDNAITAVTIKSTTLLATSITLVVILIPTLYTAAHMSTW